MIEPTQQEVMELFPDYYEGYVVGVDMAKEGGDTSVVVKPETDPVREVDEILGLEVVQKQTLEEYIGKRYIKSNSFTDSLREQFDRKGYLSEKQKDCLR